MMFPLVLISIIAQQSLASKPAHLVFDLEFIPKQSIISKDLPKQASQQSFLSLQSIKSATIAVTDIQDFLISAKIYFGSEMQRQNVVLDTGSPWIWIQSHDCQSCPTFNRFNQYESTSYLPSKDLNDNISLDYVSGSMLGRKISD